jgi:hypothetical protein
MTRLSLLARRLVLFWGVAAGCGGQAAGDDPGHPRDPDATPPGDTTAVIAQLQNDLGRLNALAIVDAPTLLVEGHERSDCYDRHPCAASAQDPAVAASYARQAPRLRALVDLAEEVAAASAYATAATDTAGDIAALNQLAIVKVNSLVQAVPASQPNCYGLPCPEDVAQAKQENRRRADAAHTLATQATRAGL